MSERTVFLVYGYDCYEYPYNPIRAFAEEADARALLARISAHQAERPDYPSDGATDDEYEAWNTRFAQWRAAHPAEHTYSHDGFDVMPLQLVEATHD